MSKEIDKPKCKLVGTDGNIFALIGVASQALKRAGLREEAKEMQEKVIQQESYDMALAVICNYVDAY